MKNGKNMNKINKKSIIECLFGSIIVLILAPLLSPSANPWYAIYGHPLYWLFGCLGCVVLSFIILYFTDINPRKFYHIVNVVPVSIFLIISTLSLITSLVLISLIENLAIKIVLLLLVIVLFLFLIYVFMHRGFCVYKNGKIRIFRLKIKTYDASKIDDIKFEYSNKKCDIIIVIGGLKEEFKLSSFSAKMIENRLKGLKD